MPYPGYTTEEVARLGEEIYQREIRDRVEASHRGKFLVIDIKTKEYVIAEDDLTASERALARNPNAVLYGLKIGFPAAYRLGGHMPLKSTGFREGSARIAKPSFGSLFTARTGRRQRY